MLTLSACRRYSLSMAHPVRTSRYGPHDPDATARQTVTVMRKGRVEVDLPLPLAIRRQIAQMNGIAHCGSPTCRHRRRKASKS